MDSRTGELYEQAAIEQLKPKVQRRLVEIDGRPHDIRNVSRAVKKQNKKDREKNKRKAERKSRKGNR
jgi:hypothetical protein